MSTQTVRLHRWDEIALEKVTEMLSRKVVTGEREMVAQIYMKRGCIVPNHSHESEQMTYVLQGVLKFVVSGEEITVREAADGDAARSSPATRVSATRAKVPIRSSSPGSSACATSLSTPGTAAAPTG